MGAYFRCYRRGGDIIKTLILKKGGSPYPSTTDFKNTLDLLRKFLGDFMPETVIDAGSGRIRIRQTFVVGADLFEQLAANLIPDKLELFVRGLEALQRASGVLPDLINEGNILVTRDGEIRLVDVWPVFTRERVESGDLSGESFRENQLKLAVLRSAVR